MDEISDLRLFTAIVSAGSLSETARRTNGSLPGMSRRLAQLEARLGAKLIDRGSRHFTLTQEGRTLYESALQVVAAIDEIEAEVGKGALSPRGHLRIGAPHQIGRRRIAAIIADFTELHPEVSVELVLTDAKLEESSEDFDIGLHVDFPGKSSAVVRKLLSSRRVLCAAPDYLQQHGTPQSVDDLSRLTCLKLVRSRYDYDRWLYWQDDQVHEHPIAAALATNCSDVLRDWAVAGRGLALKALWDIQDDLAEGRLVAVLEEQFCMELCFYVTYSPAGRLPARTRLMIDHVVAALAGTKAGTSPASP